MMRNALVQLGFVVLGVTSIHAVKLLHTASVHARIFPSGGASKIWAIQGKDSMKMFCRNGVYYLPMLHPGDWRFRIDPRRPYRGVDFEITDLRTGIDKDLGEIQLKK